MLAFPVERIVCTLRPTRLAEMQDMSKLLKSQWAYLGLPQETAVCNWNRSYYNANSLSKFIVLTEC